MRVAGSVLPDVRTVAATGQRFIAARVRCAGFEATVCLPADDDQPTPPQPGGVIAGTMLLTASLPCLALPDDEPHRRFGLPRKR